MSASSARGLRVIKAIEGYTKGQPNCFDASLIFKRVKLFDVSDERACAAFTVEQQMCNMLNTLHGGYLAAVMDALAVVQLLARRGGKLAWTTNLNVHFVGAASVGELVTVETAPLGASRRPLLLAARATSGPGGAGGAGGAGGRLLAQGLGAFVYGHDDIQQVAADFLDLDFSRDD